MVVAHPPRQVVVQLGVIVTVGVFFGQQPAGQGRVVVLSTMHSGTMQSVRGGQLNELDLVTVGQ